MPNPAWNFDGFLSGTVDGEAVNCRFAVRRDDDCTTEVWVHQDGDSEHQSTISRSPMVHAMACYFIEQLNHARSVADRSSASDPVRPTSGESRIVSLHDYRYPDLPDPAAQADALVADRAQAQSS
jgi:hypothetical protein